MPSPSPTASSAQCPLTAWHCAFTAGHALLASVVLCSAHLALVRCTRRARACGTGVRARRLAVAGLALRLALLPSHPPEESPNLVLRLSLDALRHAMLLRFAATTPGVTSATAAHVQLRHPILEQLPSMAGPAINRSRARLADDGTSALEQLPSTAGGYPVGVVLLVLESTSADAVSPLYAPPTDGIAPTAPFLSSLAARSGALVSAMHLPTMPNTNKALIELLCGLTPRIETSWDELDADFVTMLREECLPRRLSNDLGWRTMIGSAVNTPPGTLQYALGPDVTRPRLTSRLVPTT